MTEPASKSPDKPEATESTPLATLRKWHPIETLRREIDHLFDDFGRDLPRLPFGRGKMDMEPMWRHKAIWASIPAVDVVETDKAYKITAELPGMDPSNIELKFADGSLTVSGEKKEEREEKTGDTHLSERRYGAFRRSFRVPKGVDPDKIEAGFKNGILAITLLKSAAAQSTDKKIAIKAE